MPFNQAERRALEQNAELRALLRGGATVEPLSRADVTERVAALAAVPEERRGEVVDALAEVALLARSSYRRQVAAAAERLGQTVDEADRGAWAAVVAFDGLEARLRADELTVALLRRWAVADQLVPERGFDPFAPDPFDGETVDLDDSAVSADIARIPR